MKKMKLLVLSILVVLNIQCQDAKRSALKKIDAVTYRDSIPIGDILESRSSDTIPLTYLLVGFGAKMNDGSSNMGSYKYWCTEFPTNNELRASIKKENKNRKEVVILGIYIFENKEEFDAFWSEK